MNLQRITERLRSDTGFGLIEIVISMFLLAALAIAFVPILMQGLRQSTEDFTDPRGVVIRVTTTVGTCPAGPGTVEVSATAVRLDTAQQIAEAETLVFVQ
jgi:hypothetical protein